MTRIALLRHFPTDWNAERRLQGQTDTPLSDEGRALLSKRRLPGPWSGRAIVSSPLSRAMDTATALANGRPVRQDARLVELSWGLWEGQRAADLAADPEAGFVPTHEIGWTARAPGGESPEEAWTRVRPLLTELASAGRPAILVTHKALMRILLGMALGRPEHCAEVEIRRARLYPVTLSPDGLPKASETPERLETVP